MIEKKTQQRLDELKKELAVIPMTFNMPFTLKLEMAEMAEKCNVKMTHFVNLALIEYVEKIRKLPEPERPPL